MRRRPPPRPWEQPPHANLAVQGVAADGAQLVRIPSVNDRDQLLQGQLLKASAMASAGIGAARRRAGGDRRSGACWRHCDQPRGARPASVVAESVWGVLCAAARATQLQYPWTSCIQAGLASRPPPIYPKAQRNGRQCACVAVGWHHLRQEFASAMDQNHRRSEPSAASAGPAGQPPVAEAGGCPVRPTPAANACRSRGTALGGWTCQQTSRKKTCFTMIPRLSRPSAPRRGVV